MYSCLEKEILSLPHETRRVKAQANGYTESINCGYKGGERLNMKEDLEKYKARVYFIIHKKSFEVCFFGN